MSKAAHDRKKLGRHIISDINKGFNQKALDFIADMLRLDGIPVKDYPKINTDNDILKKYCDMERKITNELLWHRNRPVPQDRLDKLRLMGSLPKCPRIILESME